MDSRDKVAAQMGSADCCRLMGDFSEAFAGYVLAGTGRPAVARETALKKAMCLVEMGEAEKALAELETVGRADLGAARGRAKRGRAVLEGACSPADGSF